MPINLAVVMLTGKMRWMAAVGVLFVTAAAAGCASGSSRSAIIGRSAPAYGGPTIAGPAVASTSKPGRWVVVNFFATWCIPCQTETPQLVAFVAAHRASGDAAVVGVLYLDAPAKARSFVAAHGITWAIVNDHDGTVAERYHVTGLPQSFVIRPDGRLAVRLFGAVTEAKLDDVIGSST
ncbi:MAG: TlpA family protein disulfide reductase [Actinomycetota bacterium]|nr:TlpA family protein disulfide reductase [Actinomycetota bacterium]